MKTDWKRRIKRWSDQLKMNISAIYLAYKDKRTPYYAKILSIIVVGYALSPIDLIPDFIPVLGFIDDAILLPVLIWLSVKLIPEEVMQECQEKAKNHFTDKNTKNYVAAIIIILLWVSVACVIAINVINHFSKGATL